MAVLPAVHRDAGPTHGMEPVDAHATAPMEPVDVDATAPMEPLDVDAAAPMEPLDVDATAPMEPVDGPGSAPIEAARPAASAPTPPKELPTPMHMPAVDPPVRPTVARRRVRSSPAPRAPAPGSGSSRAIVFAAGGAAVLLIVVAGYLIGKAADSGSGSRNPRPSVSQSVAHTGTSATTGATKASTTTSAAGTTAVAGTSTFTGREFSIKYPAGWIIETNQKQYPWGTDTTVVSPANAQTLLRVDVSSHLKTSDPLTASQAEISQVSKQPGYQQLGLTSTTVNGNRGELWEFLVNDNGVLEHSVDEFIIAPNGDGLAILTQAPASKYASMATEFTALRQTLAVHTS
jgi:hypothetical protein